MNEGTQKVDNLSTNLQFIWVYVEDKEIISIELAAILFLFVFLGF